jgi:folate-binding protein YgfZ
MSMIDDYRRAREKAVLLDDSARGKIEVVGPDVRTFLHNLCTNDIKNLSPGRGCEAFFATAQARAVAYGFIYCADGMEQPTFWIDADPGQNEKLLKHLDRYIISEQVELTDHTSGFHQLHVAGPEANTVLAACAQCSALPEAELQHMMNADLSGVSCQIRRHSPLGLPGYDILCPRESAERVQRALLESGASLSTPEVYQVLRIEAGTPRYGVDIDDNRLVMEVGRTPQAISYTKGCYLGQEPIVMARDRGHINRTLMGLKLSTSAPLPRDTKLFREGKEAGQLTSSVVSPHFGTIALAYLRRGNQEPGTPLEFEVGGVKGSAEVTPLPFQL